VSEQATRWELPGYGDITAARVIDGDLEVVFANGDLVRVPLASLAVDTRSGLTVDVDDGLAVRIGKDDEFVNVIWTQIRSATDPAYAAHFRAVHGAEAARIGRRLKALREDRGLALRDLADAAGISTSRLTRVEKGQETLPVSVLESLLSTLDATFSDISGPNALEISTATIIANAGKAGVARDLLTALASAVPRNGVPDLLARAFRWSRTAILAGVPVTPPLPVLVQFKAPASHQPTNSPIVHFALSTARLARTAFDFPPYSAIPDNPGAIRQEAIEPAKGITLQSLLRWVWSRGIPVLPLWGKGGFEAAVLRLDDGPTIVIKESRSVAAYWLFDLAHELGHVALGHARNAIVDVEAPSLTEASPDEQEREATEFALELLLPNHQSLLNRVRDYARGSGVRFKFGVEEIAAAARVSPALLGMVAAFALPDVGRPKDRWGSATNLAKLEGDGRSITREFAHAHATLDRLPELDAALVKVAVFGPADEP
jgi:transcriptional regulator with XRE-family HTH domain/Zn-dependent peptidase ImmA (M78 family)